MAVPIYCPKCEAPNDETRPRCEKCGYQLKPRSVGHTLSLDELYERQTMLGQGLKYTREIETAIKRLEMLEDQKAIVLAEIDKYRQSLIGQQTLVGRQICEALDDVVYEDNE